MKQKNRELFDALPLQFYLKSDGDQNVKMFRTLTNFQGALGFNDESGGFVAIHHCHSPSGLLQELPVCISLKQMGYGVILLEEPPNGISPDALILERYFEIKRISKARNIHSAIFYQFRTAYRKSSNLILHIDQVVNLESLRNALYISAKHYAAIKVIWVVYDDKLWQFDRAFILKGQHQFTHR